MSLSVFKTQGSGLFSEVSYDRERLVLTITFRKDGVQWAYPGVKESLWVQFLRAESMGSFYAANIKGKFYDAYKVLPAPVVEDVPDWATGGTP